MRKIAIVVLSMVILISCSEETIAPIESKNKDLGIDKYDSLQVNACCPIPPKCCN